MTNEVPAWIPPGLWRRRQLAVAGVFALAAVWAWWDGRHIEVDDAYIYYRYVYNLVAGQGLVFNPGERVYALASPLYALLLVPAAAAGQLPGAGHLLTAALSAAAAFAAFTTLDRAGATVEGLLCGLLLLRYPPLLTAVGLETPLLLVLLFASIRLCSHRIWGPVVFALLPLTRPEALMVVPLLVLWWAGARRAAVPGRGHLVRQLLPGVVIFVAIAGGALAAATVYYGSPIPESLHAKIAQGQSGKWASGAPFAAELVHFGAPGVLPLVAAAVLGLVHLARAAPARRTAAVMLGLSASIVAGYTVLGIPPYRWYYLPLEATMLLLAAVGLGALLRQGLRILRRPWLVAAPGLVLIGALTVFGLRGPPLNPPDHFGQDKVEPYRQVGAYLHDQAPPGASVALAEVGIIGFVSGIHVVDLLGIVTPWPAETIRRGHDVDQLRQVQADYYLDLSGNMTVPGYRVEATFGPYRLHRRQPGSPGAPP